MVWSLWLVKFLLPDKLIVRLPPVGIAWLIVPVRVLVCVIEASVGASSHEYDAALLSVFL